MAPLGYLEILDPKGRVAQRFEIESFPLTIGRAYKNRIILDDPFVCPEHLWIGRDETGSLLARDLDSVNGLHAIDAGRCATTLPLHSGTEFRIGHTHLRYCDVGHRVSPATVDRAGIVSRFASPYAGAAAGAFVLVVLLSSSYFASYERLNLARSLSESLTTLSMVLVWAGFWALTSRVISSRFHYPQHFALACAAILGSLAMHTAAEWIEFVFPASQMTWIAGVAGSAFILAALVYGHLSLVSPMLRRARLWTGVAISVTVIGLGVISDYANRNAFSTAMEYSGILKPIEAALLPADSIDRFIADSDRLKSELDALAEKARASRP